MARRRLGQEIEIPPDTGPSGQGEALAPEQASAFGALWTRFTEIWPDVFRLRDDIASQRDRWERLAADAYARGDIEGMRAYRQRVTQLDAAERERSEVQATVERMRDAWYALRDWLRGIGSWFGVSSLGGLGLPPVVLAVGAATAIATLGWVVQTILRLRAEVDQDRQILEAAERGVLTPAQAAQVLAQRERGEPLVSIGGTAFGLPVVALVAGGLVLLWWLGGRRA